MTWAAAVVEDHAVTQARYSSYYERTSSCADQQRPIWRESKNSGGVSCVSHVFCMHL